MVSVAELTLVLQGKDDLSKTLKTVATDSESLNKKVDTLGKTSKDTGDKASKASGDFDKAGKSAKEMGDKADDAGGHLGGLGSKLGSVASIASGFVIGAGILKAPGFFMEAAQAAAEDEQSTARLSATIKTLGGDYDSQLAKVNVAIAANQKLGFSDDETRDSFDKLALATGSTSEALSRQKLAMDLSRGANIPLADASKLLGKVTDENLQVFKKMGITLPDVANEADVLAAVQKKFAGQSDAYAKSTAGQFAILKDRMGEAKEAIGYALLPVMTKLGDIAIKYVAPAIEKMVGVFSDLVEAGLDKLGGWLEAAKGPAQSIGETLLSWGSASLDFIKDTLWPFLQDVGGSIGSDAATVLTAVKDALVTAGGVAFDFIKDPLWPFLQDVGGAIGSAAATAFTTVKDALLVAGAVTFDFIANTLWPFLKDLGGDLGSKAASALTSVKDAIAGLGGDSNKVDFGDLSAAFAGLKDKLQPAYDILKPLAETILNDLRGDLRDVKEAAQPFREELEKWQPVLEPLGKLLGGAMVLAIAAFMVQVDIIVKGTLLQLKLGLEAATLALGFIRTAFNDGTDAALEFADKVTTAWDHAKTVSDDIKAFFTELPGKVKNAIGDVAGTLKDKGIDFLTGLQGGIVEKFADVWDWGMKLPNKIVNAIGDTGSILYDAGWGLVTGLFSGILDKFTSGIGAITSKLDPRNWDIPGLSPFVPAMEHAGQIAGTHLVGGMIQGIAANAGEIGPAVAAGLGSFHEYIDPAVTGLGSFHEYSPAPASGGFNGIPGAMDPAQWSPGSGPDAIYTWGNPYTLSANGPVTAGGKRAGNVININIPPGTVITDMDGFVTKLKRELARAVA